MIFSGVAAGLGAAFGGQGPSQAIGSFINFVLGTFVAMGVTAFFLKAHDSTETVESKELWHPQPFWLFLATKLLTGVVVVLGIILLIVPGIIFGLMFMFAQYIVIDKEIGPIEAMKESKKITDGHKWNLLGLCLLLALINILGAICLLVGLLVTIPVTSLALIRAYRTLSAHPHPHATA
jgi:uncharacterized membrane protein